MWADTKTSERPKVLIIDDDKRYLQSLAALLEPHYEIITDNNSLNALGLAMTEQPYLILLDLVMENIDGYQVIRELKQNLETTDIPVIIVTGSHETEDESLCLRLGAVDYITKPFTPEIVMARVQTHVELKRQKELLKILSYQDGLTGIANRRYFDDMLIHEHRRCKRAEAPLSTLMIDIDFFKLYNDIYGHLTGDDCLKLVAKSMHAQLSRSGDLLARYGGEEFVCVLPNTDLNGASNLADKLRAAVIKQQIPHEAGIDGMVTVSIGVVSGKPVEGVDPRKFLQQADHCLYQAKVSGRNRIHTELCCEESLRQTG
ncbi:MAG: diguanylate cyclase [Chromatiales bacterium]|jgi:diguanylate cyclase (GGDEF)-like protein